MKFNRLGRTDLEVSELCLGSMTWGTQNTEQEGHEQMSYAFEQGINFIDTAELYPTTPLSAETQGRTEEIIGSWCKANGNRDKVIVATKVCGRGTKWIQNGKAISPEKIINSVEGSLKRLQTDYIDLYQLHWPNRQSYHFRQSWEYQPSASHKQPLHQVHHHMLEVLQTLQSLQQQGKIRHVGLSNETCWGTSQFLQLADKHKLPRVVSVQNEYSLLHRLYDLDFAELTHYEEVGLLAFSPLAAGLLSGKYRNGQIPAGSRRSMQENLSGRLSEHSEPALEKYLAIADKHGLAAEQMALAFCTSRPFMTSVIIGATTMEQLKSNVSAAELTLSDEVMAEIAAVHRAFPIPM